MCAHMDTRMHIMSSAKVRRMSTSAAVRDANNILEHEELCTLVPLCYYHLHHLLEYLH